MNKIVAFLKKIFFKEKVSFNEKESNRLKKEMCIIAIEGGLCKDPKCGSCAWGIDGKTF